MNYDKVTYLFWSIIVFILIFASSFLINYGRNIISSENFGMFFSWYAALIVINLFNILLNLIYHFFMKDLVGPRGIKGEIGERGPPGKDDKCGCAAVPGVPDVPNGFEIAESDGIKSIPIKVDGTNAGTSVVSGTYTQSADLTGSIGITESKLKSYLNADTAAEAGAGAVADAETVAGAAGAADAETVAGAAGAAGAGAGAGAADPDKIDVLLDLIKRTEVSDLNNDFKVENNITNGDLNLLKDKIRTLPCPPNDYKEQAKIMESRLLPNSDGKKLCYKTGKEYGDEAPNSCSYDSLSKKLIKLGLTLEEDDWTTDLTGGWTIDCE